MTNEIFYKFFDDDELLRISKKISVKEKITAGEIVVSIKEKKSFFQKSKSVEQMAQKEFYRLRINNTRDKTGILIYIILAERQFYILADSGINSKVESNTWEVIKDKMQNNFRSGEFCKGILNAVDEVGNILSRFFPIKPDDTNEISNMVIVRR